MIKVFNNNGVPTGPIFCILRIETGPLEFTVCEMHSLANKLQPGAIFILSVFFARK